MIILHEKAKENINTKAKELLNLIKRKDLPKSESVQLNDLYASATITEQDIIGEIEMGLSNGIGVEQAKYFYWNESSYGLFDDDYIEFEKVALQISNSKTISEYVEINYTKKQLFKWLKGRFQGIENNEFIDYFLGVLELDVKSYQILIPIPFTVISRDFKMGEIEFKTLREQVIDEWFDRNKNIEPEKQVDYANFKKRIQEKCQGYAVGVYNYTAEKDRACELAYNNLSNTLSILRLFTLPNFTCECSTILHEYGRSMIRTEEYFIIDEQNDIHYTSNNLENNLITYIDNKIIDDLESKGFNNFSKLLIIKDKNNYQKKLLEALIIYSKHTLRNDISDKIVSILVALETIFLKNNTESIQQNIGERVAFLIGKDAKERRAIVENIKEIYKIRSKFIHHGNSFGGEIELVNRFILTSWTCFFQLVNLMDKYHTIDELIANLEELKYS